jgi:hypothetical protein
MIIKENLCVTDSLPFKYSQLEALSSETCISLSTQWHAQLPNSESIILLWPEVLT